MPEVKKEVKTYMVTYTCDECEIGNMKFTGIMLASNPGQYVHECDQCGNTMRVRSFSYPRTVHEEISE